jgi:tetratricopeptide (TPR) repeat protein
MTPVVLLLALAVASPSDSQPARFEFIRTRDRFDADGASERVQEARVHVRDSAGVAQFGQIAVPYVDGYGDVVFDALVIEKPDGRRIEVTAPVVEDLNPFGITALPVPADLKLKRLIVPGLEPRDRFSWRITVRQKPIFPAHVFGEMQFMKAGFAAEQAYELDLPADRQIAVRLRPGLGPAWEDVSSPPGRRIRRLTVRDADTAGGRQDATEESDTAELEPDVIFSSFRTWTEVGRWWWQLAQDRLAPDAAVRAEAQRLTEGRATARAKLEALHAFVARNIRYLSVSFGAGRMRPRPPAEVLSTRFGDCKDKHALLAALASAVGIELRPVLVNSFRPDLHDDVPGPHQFDHMMSVAILGPQPKDWLWLDSTMDLAPFGHLLSTIRGKRALLVDADERSHVVSVPEGLPYTPRILVESRARLDPNGPLRAHVVWKIRGDDEPTLRLAAAILPQDKRDELGNAIAEEWTKGKVTGVTFSDPMDVSEAFRLEYDVVHTMTAKTFEKDWDLWLPLPEMKLPDPLKKPGANRVAVRLGLPNELVTRAECEVPEAMKGRAPIPVVVERPFATYRSTYSVDGHALRVERVLQIQRRSITTDEVASYEAFRRAVRDDWAQKFPLAAFHTTAKAPETADELNSAGLDALDRGENDKAVELLRRATEKDPTHKWAWNNLGRALRVSGNLEDALKAFTHQIEINPFDEYSYANRGAALMLLGRVEQAEKDLLKQIEVAPLRPRAYRGLADLRTRAGRHGEAAELLARAASADRDNARTWLELGWAQVRAGRIEAAKPVLERARSLDGRPAVQLSAARALRRAGDSAAATALAEESADKLSKTFSTLSAPSTKGDATEDAWLLGEAWRLLGLAALDKGDLPTADRYLAAAWELTSWPEMAVSLGELRERQGRSTDAVEVYAQGASITLHGSVNPAEKRLEEAVKDRKRRRELIDAGNIEALSRRTVQVEGAAPVDFQGRAMLLFDATGQVEAAEALDEADRGRFEELKGLLRSLRVRTPAPDDRPRKLLRRAVVTCNRPRGCTVILEMPNIPSLEP